MDPDVVHTTRMVIADASDLLAGEKWNVDHFETDPEAKAEEHQILEEQVVRLTKTYQALGSLQVGRRAELLSQPSCSSCSRSNQEANDNVSDEPEVEVEDATVCDEPSPKRRRRNNGCSIL